MKITFWLFGAILLASCTGPSYETDDTVAFLDNEEITVEDVMVQYSIEEGGEDVIEGFLKQEVVVQEAKDMGITVSDEEIEESKQAMMPGSEVSERYEALEDQSDQTFYERQASALDMVPEEYFEVWEDKTYTSQAYMDKYISETFDEPASEEDAEAFADDVNDHIDALFEEYQEDGRLVVE
ncbi:hypothetical protein [Texcoconibacillus texcoconensis]|uniref:Lipoprotein n=1 Tax=Texcoconibacillus texcoconensis TaxID=1095777 RepID=A0A840QM18_9BACI|nr:hypothetical protein [Texcoconibacillus texcoconensis]MBB5172391.1 hypothetical protein [Texcoconibacillus texcoconensis]